MAGVLTIIAGAAIGQQGTQPGSPGTQPPTREPGQPGRDPMQPGRDQAPGQTPGQPGRDSTQPGRQPPGLTRAPGQEQKVSQAEIDRLSASWPQANKTALRDMTTKYGLPDAATPMMVVWRSNGPWKYSIVYGAGVQHNFPEAHTDVLEQFIDYRVPVEKVGELARFDGSVIVARTAGLLAAWCDKEAMNFLALNLSHEIITGKRTAEDARQFFAQEAARFKQGQTSTYTQGLMFEPERTSAGDPDRPVTPTTRSPLGTPESDPMRTPRTPGSETPTRPGETPGRPGERPGERPGTTDPTTPPRPSTPPG
ncbi:MAG: hypothetical protein WD749_10375 [Phycisphaerales bacterium]